MTNLLMPVLVLFFSTVVIYGIHFWAVSKFPPITRSINDLALARISLKLENLETVLTFLATNQPKVTAYNWWLGALEINRNLLDASYLEHGQIQFKVEHKLNSFFTNLIDFLLNH